MTSQGSGVQSPSLLFIMGCDMRRLFLIIMALLILVPFLHADDDQLVKIVNREKELLEMEKNLNMEMNERKNSILNRTNECLSRAKTRKEIAECNKFKRDEMEFLEKERKYRKEQIVNERKNLQEEKRKLRKGKRKK